jgi:hypothetical protein
MNPLTQQIRKVSTGKIVPILESITDEKNKNCILSTISFLLKLYIAVKQKDAMATLSKNDVQALATLVTFLPLLV